MEQNEDSEKVWQAIGLDPVEGARLCQQQIKLDELSVQARRRRRIAEGYYIGLQLMNDYAAWQRFLAEPFFDRDPRIRNKKEDRFKFVVMRTVMIYLFMAGKGNDSLRNRTWRYARAMSGYADEGVPPEEVVDRIKSDGGIEKLARARSKGYDLEAEDEDWRLEMAHREPAPPTDRAQARTTRDSHEIVCDEGQSEPGTDDDDDDDEAVQPYVDPDPTEGMVTWPILVDPDELRDLDRTHTTIQVRATISIDERDDGSRYYRAIMIDYL
ncbi:hypothetical protein LRS73_31805 [Methylobacterium currus]|uniref:hypothetical protein n=1 Tax=Methylobacterium currus TaxID=2051553 RepID=UPI001E5C0147|nr:hypothetical protein [Methylobacterium currus]UHC19443.1 hypothetical protein LRS73_31805 [Methylobacterium currus]